MNNFWIYLLQSGIALWLFYAIYWLFLRKETFFSLNRFILLGSVAMSLILPLIRLENLFALPASTSIPSFFMNFGSEVSAASEPSAGQIDIKRLIALTVLMVYISGVLFLATRLIYQIINLIRLTRKHPVINRDRMRIVYLNEEIAPCSFFNYIFINRSMHSDEELEKIILHESAHVKNIHLIDLILFGITCILQWFNPVMWLFERSIREVHEYEADREVLKQKPDRIRYQAMLVNQVAGIEIFKLANSFSKSITKKRMIMMSKMKSAKLSSAKVLLVLPVILCLVFAFSKPQIIGESSQSMQPKQVAGKVVDAETNDPLIGAAVVIEGTSEGTVTVEDGKFSIQVPGNDKVLVISYVGYETKAVKADRPEIEVKMKKKVYDLPEDNVLKPGEEKTLAPPPPPPPPTTGEEIFTVVEEMPKFQGKDGEGFREYIAQNIIYPEEAKKNGIQGMVFVQFTVNEKGEVVDVIVVRGVSPSLDAEAIRVTQSSPLWEPGKQKGKPVDVQFTFPINFALGEKK
jgi:TonB family protein